MGYSYHTEQWLPYPVEAVFAFFADPGNLPALMPPWQQARLEKTLLIPPPDAPPAGIPTAGNGTRVTLSFRPFPHFPLRVRWEAEVTEFSSNGQFCDAQIRGPFLYWYHCHRLRPVDRQGMDMTLIVDHVEYQLPYGFLGRLAHRFFLRRQIEELFTFRQGQLAQIFARMPAKSAPAPRPQKQSA